MSNKEAKHIISQLKVGNMFVLETIYRHNRNSFLNFAKKYRLPEDDIIDIYQDAIIALRDNAVNGKIEQLNSSVQTYLFSISKYMIYKKLKTSNNHSLLIDDMLIEDESVLSFDFQEETDSSDQQLVDKAFDDLGQRCQQILKLFYYDGLTLKEIQNYLKYQNYKVAKSQKSRCLKTLKDLINKQNPHE